MIDNTTEWEFEDDVGIYLTEKDIKTGFVAEISSGVTVNKNDNAIQGWIAPTDRSGTTLANKMAFDETLSLNNREIILSKST